MKRIYPINISRIAKENLRPTFQVSLAHPKLGSSHLKVHSKDLPSIVDLRPKFPSVYDQGDLGSCTANALCSVIFYNINLLGSRLFLYYNERQMENTVNTDSGALISDGVLSLEKYGICPETIWPYDISKYTVKPDNRCYVEALRHISTKVNHLPNDIYQMRLALSNGFPFVAGIAIYESFEHSSVYHTGMVPLPDVSKEQLLGGHAVVCVGYDNSRQLWIMRNSWGTNWGDHGYFYLPYAYLLDSSLSSDLWCITHTT